MFYLNTRLTKRILGVLALSASLAMAGELKMATTTSTDNTGLLDVLAPKYKADTGAALKLGENCDADILFVHSPAVEKKFVEDGFGVDRTPIMYNDFVILGEPKYKEKFAGKNIQDAFAIIKNEKIKFVSRGDKS